MSIASVTVRTYLAVDPGGSGAVAWSNRQGTYCRDMPETRREVMELFIEALTDSHNPVAYMEKVVPYIPDGGASQMFQYGRNVERPGCILECVCRIRVIEITPQAWQKALALGKSDRISPPRMPAKLGPEQKKLWRLQNSLEIKAARDHNAKAKRDWKRKLRDECQRRFPDQKVTYKNCDALLLLDAAIKLEGESLNLNL